MLNTIDKPPKFSNHSIDIHSLNKKCIQSVYPHKTWNIVSQAPKFSYHAIVIHPLNMKYTRITSLITMLMVLSHYQSQIWCRQSCWSWSWWLDHTEFKVNHPITPKSKLIASCQSQSWLSNHANVKSWSWWPNHAKVKSQSWWTDQQKLITPNSKLIAWSCWSWSQSLRCI